MLTSDKWLIAYTKPNQEKMITKRLDEKGILNFLPLVAVYKNGKRSRPQKYERPMFSSYLFVRPKNKQEYIEALSIDGIKYFLKSDGALSTVDESLIKKLQGVNSYSEDVEIYERDWLIGERVTVRNIFFFGQECEVIDVESKRKILVRVNILNRLVVATVSSSIVA